MSVAAPQLISNLGTPGFGYSVPAALEARDFTGALDRLATNEVILFTGYDMKTGGWNIQAPLLNYGLPIAMKFARKIIGPRRIGPISLL